MNTLPPHDVENYEPADDAAQFWMPEVTDPDDRENLPYITKRSGDERMDLRTTNVLQVEERTVDNQQFVVYTFNWALFLTLLEDRRIVRRMTTQYDINHQQCQLSPTEKAKLVEEVWCRNVRDVRLRAIQHALNSGGFGADGLDADLQAKSRRDFLRQQASGSMPAEDEDRLHFACQTRGVRDLVCTDTPPDKDYRVFQVVSPYKWFDGRPFDHASTSTLILTNDEQQKHISLTSGNKHAISARACLGDHNVDRLYNDSNHSTPLKHHVDSEIFYRHYMNLVTQGCFQGSPWDLTESQRQKIAACVGDTDEETQRLRRAKTQRYRKRIFLKKWIRDFPPPCRARFLLPVSKHAGHQPQLDVEQLMQASQPDAHAHAAALDLNGLADPDSDSDSDSGSDAPPPAPANDSQLDMDMGDSEDEEEDDQGEDDDEVMGDADDDDADDDDDDDDQGQWLTSRKQKGSKRKNIVSDDDDHDDDEEEGDEGEEEGDEGAGAGGGARKRKKKRRKRNVSRYFEDAAAHDGSGGDSEDEDEDDSDADENGNLQGFVVPSDSDGDLGSGVEDCFASALAASHALDMRDAAESAFS